MSEAGRRRPGRARPALAAHRLGARATAALTAVALGAAVAVPAAMMSGGEQASRQAVRGASAGTLVNARTDQIRGREWHLKALHAQKAWKYSKGRGVTVAVLDTGVDANHPDLTGHVISGPDLTGGVRRPGTRYWGLHGTSMASIISGHGHGPGQSQGMLGVAPLSHILSVRVTLENDDPLRRDGQQQNGAGEHDAVAQGIRYAVDHGAGIINMSLGGGRQFYNGTAAQESAIKYALSKNVVLIASAGNDGSGANRKNFPAAYPGVIAVGALDRRLRLWKDSNRRSHAALCAPGVDIVSADASNGYVVGTGTSASSAMVAGVAALVRSRYPKLTPAEVRQVLIQGSPARRGHPTGSPTCRGTVDALRTLYAAHEINKTSAGPVETQPPSPAPAPTPAAALPERDSGVLLPLVLGGGGLLVVLGLVLGWRQRRRPEDDTEETEDVPEYGLPSAPAVPREPAAVASGPPAGEPGMAPVNVPLWQNTQAYQGPPFDLPPAVPDDGAPPESEPAATSTWDAGTSSWGSDTSAWDSDAGASSWDTEAGTEPDAPEEPLPPPIEPKQPPMVPHELRPFVPGEHASNGTNGHGSGNGHDVLNGHDLLNGHGAGSGRHAADVDGAAAEDAPPLDDDDWEAFRRGALDLPDPGTTAPLAPEPPAVPPMDEAAADAFPADEEPPPGPVQPDDQASDDPHGRRSRHARPAEDEDYRPPWW
ncbi:S8 family serine peptidase [Actinomadura sp.]|uniref:S8 family peptidase n=1 Tax=Actinomadura sp. TaxID=1989 RepID=UPI0037CA08BF